MSPLGSLEGAILQGRLRATLNGICPAAGGGFVIVGESETGSSPSIRSVYVAKTGRDGSVLRKSNLAGEYPSGARSLELAGNGDYIISTGGGPNLIRVDPTGAPGWTKNVGTITILARSTPDGGFIPAGTVGSRETGHLVMNPVRVNAYGGIEWERL